jgi:hypothetical protein
MALLRSLKPWRLNINEPNSHNSYCYIPCDVSLCHPTNGSTLLPRLPPPHEEVK